MNDIAEIKKACEAIKTTINIAFDRLLLTLDGDESSDLPINSTYPLTADTNIFIGRKAVAVLFGEERVNANNWRNVFAVIMARCNADTKCHENLMYLRDKVTGRDRILLSHSPDSMRRPLRIDEEMYAEVCYGTATLLYILRDRILTPAHFDYSGINITIK